MRNTKTKNGFDDIAQKYGIDIEKYRNEKMTSVFVKQLDSSTSFSKTVIIYFIVALVLFLSISTAYGIYYKTTIFPVLIFISSIPVIIGLSILGVGKAFKKMISGINGIIDHTLGMIEDVYNSVIRNKGSEQIKITEIGTLVGYEIVLPAIGSWTKKKFLGGIIFILLKKTVKGIVDFISNMNLEGKKKDKEVKSEKNESDNHPKKTADFKGLTEKIGKLGNNTVKGITFLCGLLFFILLFIGLIVFSVVLILKLSLGF